MFEVIDSILQKIVEIYIVDSQRMPCLNDIYAYKYTRTGRRDERLLVLK